MTLNSPVGQLCTNSMGDKSHHSIVLVSFSVNVSLFLFCSYRIQCRNSHIQKLKVSGLGSGWTDKYQVSLCSVNITTIKIPEYSELEASPAGIPYIQNVMVNDS